MLRALRSKSQSFLFKIFLVLIVLGFAAWGVGDLTGNKIQPIFKTENYEITYENVINDFNKVRSTNSGTIGIQTAIKNGLLNNVLIQNKAKLIVKEEAHNLGLTIPRNLLKKKISENKMFQSSENGSSNFSQKKFNTVLRNNNLTEDEYISSLKIQMLNDQIFDKFGDFYSYNKTFATNFLKWQNQKIDLTYKYTPFLKNPNIKIDEEAKQTYFEKNKDQFVIPKLRNVSLINFKADLFYKTIKVSKEEIENLYEDKLNDFKKLENRNYFQIIFKTNKEAESFFNNVSKNNNFVKEAKKLNLNQSDIEFKEVFKKSLPQKLGDIIFKQNKKTLIKPFKTNFGVHVIQINKINKETVKTISQVSEALENEIKYNASIEKLYDKIDKINDFAFSGNNLQEIINLSDIPDLKITKIFNISEKGLIYKNFRPQNNSINKKLLDEIWRIDMNEVSELIEIKEDEFVLINVDKEFNQRALKYDDAKKLVEEKLRKDLRIQMSKSESEKLFSSSNFKNLKKISGLKRSENQGIEKLFTLAIINKIFSSKLNKIYSIPNNTGILTYKINKKIIPNISNKEKIRIIDNNFKNELISDIQTVFFKNFENIHNVKTNLNSLENLIKSN